MLKKKVCEICCRKKQPAQSSDQSKSDLGTKVADFE
jgi:hypothetical protein